MKYLGVIIDPKDLVTKEYVDNAVLGGTSTFYRKYENSYVTSTVPISTIPIGMNVVTSADMLFVDINGLDLIQNVDYTISGTNIVLTTPINVVGQTVHIILLRMVNVTASDYNALKGDPGDISDVLVNNNSVVSNGIANILPSALMNIFYPVGSYYETSDTTFNPNTAWGGTWELETEGQVHVSSGTGYSVSGALTNNSDGGNKDAIVPYHNHSVNQFSTGGEASHTHSLSSHTHGTGGSASEGTDRFLVHSTSSSTGVSRRSIKPGTGTAITNNLYSDTAVTRKAATGGPSNNTSGAGTSHSHTVGAHSTNYTPSSDNKTDANMPPYVVVNRWHRIA